MEIIIQKRHDVRLTDDHRKIVNAFLLQQLAGATEKDQKAWRGFWGGVAKAPAGAFFTVTIKRQRNGKFHRLIMKVLADVFAMQDTFTDFRIFRAFVALGAEHVDYVPTPEGLTAIPKSLSFEDCSEEEAREFFERATGFLRTRHAQAAIWPDATPKAADDGMMQLLRKFDHDPYGA